MRIGIDVRLLQMETGLTGIANILLEELRSLNELDTENDYFLFSRKPICCDISFHKNWHLVVKDFPQGMIWYNTVLIRLLKAYEIDVFWSTNYIMPMRKPKRCKYIVTIHDLAIFKFRGIGECSNVIKQHLFVKQSCKIADKIFADSKATKQDLLEIFSLPQDKIIVNYVAGLRQALPYAEDEWAAVREKYQLKRSFFFFIGTLEPRKNLITLVKAYEKLRDEEREALCPQLVIAGGKGWNFKETQDYIDQSPYRQDILQIGYISNLEKQMMLSRCECFVFPSLYEGFGIPILEAMACGALVITTNISSIPEVAGDAAIYIDQAENVKALAGRMRDILHMGKEEKSMRRAEALRQNSKFSWEKTAQRIITVMKDVYEEK